MWEHITRPCNKLHWVLLIEQSNTQIGYFVNFYTGQSMNIPKLFIHTIQFPNPNLRITIFEGIYNNGDKRENFFQKIWYCYLPISQIISLNNPVSFFLMFFDTVTLTISWYTITKHFHINY